MATGLGKLDFARKVRKKGMLVFKTVLHPYQIRSICPDESFGECAGLHHAMWWLAACDPLGNVAGLVNLPYQKSKWILWERSAFGQFMSTNKCPKGGVVTRTAGQAGFVSNTSNVDIMFHGAWRRKDGLFCDSSQLDISFPQFRWTSPTSPYTFWVFGVLLAIPDPSSENQPVPGKYPEVSCSFQRLEWQPGPSLKPFQGSSAFKASLVATFPWQRLEVLSRTWISKYQNLEEFKISKKCVYMCVWINLL